MTPKMQKVTKSKFTLEESSKKKFNIISNAYLI